MLGSGSILMGGVGTGKSLTALVYFYERECKGKFEEGKPTPPMNPMPLYIITTAQKRDKGEWLDECHKLGLDGVKYGIEIVVDSWNNIAKYVNVNRAFFIFDEQRVVGSGKWAQSFIKISRRNHWILLSATPGDTWMDYVPVFIANGFYRTRSDFVRRHVVYSRFAKYPKIEKYLDVTTLERHRRAIIVHMDYLKKTVPNWYTVLSSYDESIMDTISKERWNPYENQPIQDISGVCYLMRRVASDTDERMDSVKAILKEHPKAIIFYNFDYELERLRALGKKMPIAEWNGHKHEPIPKGDKWAYLVQYTAGAEGWNCIETDTIIFYSQNYSYKIMTQAAGRIDRLNTPFVDLHYYICRTSSSIDNAIAKAIKEKRDFNEKLFVETNSLAEHTL